MNCSNAKCKKDITNEGHEMGTPSGYSDDYVFCDDCAVKAKKHFNIARWHDGGMMSAPQCEGYSDETNIPHTCPFTEEERKKAMAAFKHYG